MTTYAGRTRGRGIRAWRSRALLLAAAAVAAVPGSADAQYFGRNKVQYSAFDFHVLETEHFDVHYYPELSEAAREAGRMAERWFFRLSDLFGHRLTSKQPLILYANHGDFQQTNVISGAIDESTGGVTEGLQRRVVMPLGATRQDTDHVLGHELVHAFQYDLAALNGGLMALNALPLWTVEGLAEYLSVGRGDPHTAMWLRDAVLHDDIPTIHQLATDGRYFPYRFGQAVWAYIGGAYGDQLIGELFVAALRRGWDPAVVQVLGVTSDALSESWAATLRQAYGPLMEGRAAPAEAARAVLEREVDPGETMLAPAVSPDGRYVAYLGVGEFDIDLLLADTRTGEVRRLLGQGSNAHFDALSFMGSAGSWSPDGTRLAAVVFSGGRQELAIVDVARRDVVRRIRVEGVNSVSHPAWSPDGATIAISGSVGGRRDLYLIDVTSGEASRITRGPFAALQPAWSPDGHTLAFVTDRTVAADLEKLEYRSVGIALLDVASGEVRELDLLPGRNTNPVYTPDGRGLYFLSDWDGFRDIYRVELESGDVSRVTRLATGVSGLTPLSPALSVSSAGDLYFSAFERRGYVLRTIDAAGVAAALEPMEDVGPGAQYVVSGEPGTRRVVALAGRLPPFDGSGAVERYLADAESGLVDGEGFADRPYRARPKLSYVGLPVLGAQFGGFNAGLYAQLEGFFTDVLGNHNIYAMALANGGFGEVGGSVFYENRSRRLNWGAGLAHIPILERYGYQRPRMVDVGGVGRLGRETIEVRRRWQYDEAVLMGLYPLSTTRRFELGVGALHVDQYYRILRTTVVDGRVVERHEIDVLEPQRHTLGRGIAAFVGDFSIFGFTSPIAGGRYRFEIAPAIGTLSYYEATADWRRYFYRRPLTLAVRALHWGRYGEDAAHEALRYVYLGSEGLVRGYEYGTFSSIECTGVSSGETGCPIIDRLIGTRIALAGLELRVPLFGVPGYALVDFPFLPTELAGFVDAGVAWRSGDELVLRGGDDADITVRSPVTSAGVSLRLNFFNAFVIETYYAVPFQRETGGRIGFQLLPGW